MKTNKKFTFLMTVLIVCGSMSGAKESEEDKTLIGSLVGTGMTSMLGPCMVNEKCRTAMLDMIKQVKIKEFGNKLLSKAKTGGMKLFAEIIIRRLPMEKLAKIALILDVEVPGLTRVEVERISRGDIEGLAQEKIDKFEEVMRNKALEMKGKVIDYVFGGRPMPKDIEVDVEDLTDEEFDDLEAEWVEATPSQEELIDTVKNVGKQARRDLQKARVENPPETVVQNFMNKVGENYDPTRSQQDFKPAAQEASAQTKFFDNYRAIYKQKGASGFKEILKDYKNKWLEENPHIPKKQTARKFLEDMSKIMGKEVADIHGEYGAKLDNMSADKLMKKSSVMDALERGMEPIFEPHGE